MAYCPDCLTEYAEGSTECIDCHTPLVAGTPPAETPEPELELTSDAELVQLRTFSGPTAPMDAELAQNILKTQGIPCALPGEGHADMLPGIDVVQLLVRKQDAARAEEILEGFLDHPEPIPEETATTPEE